MPDADDIAAIYALLGYDPEATHTLILQPDSVLAIATEYPEPHTAPEEAPDASE